MGKWKQEDVEDLKKAGLLSKKAIAEIEKKKLVSKPRVIKRFMKTADNKWVEPKLYFRNSRNTKPSKKMEELTNKVNGLFIKYATVKQS